MKRTVLVELANHAGWHERFVEVDLGGWPPSRIEVDGRHYSGGGGRYPGLRVYDVVR